MSSVVTVLIQQLQIHIGLLFQQEDLGSNLALSKYFTLVRYKVAGNLLIQNCLASTHPAELSVAITGLNK